MRPPHLRPPTIAGLAAAGALIAAGTSGVATAQPSSSTSSPDRGIVDIQTTLEGGGTAAGTGMALPGAAGVILTNNHVIAGARSIVVTDVTTGRRRRATVAGYDVADDVAVLRVAGSAGLPTVTVGDSSAVRVGDAVTAVGNAGGVGGTPAASRGTVVALHRTITVGDGSGSGGETLADVIEVDAELLPGDSGGPLLDAAGRVVGMDSAAEFGAGYGAAAGGTGYAIPIDVAERIAGRILSGRASARVHIGATARLGVEVASAVRWPGAPAARGALVAGVMEGTPAARAGLESGDAIVSLGGRRVRSAAALTAAMLAHHPRDAVRVVWIDVAGVRRASVVTLAAGTPA